MSIGLSAIDKELVAEPPEESSGRRKAAVGRGVATSKLVLYTERTVLDCVYGFLGGYVFFVGPMLCFFRRAIAMLSTCVSGYVFSWGR
jgi:hypothetical protein